MLPFKSRRDCCLPLIPRMLSRRCVTRCACLLSLLGFVHELRIEGKDEDQPPALTVSYGIALQAAKQADEQGDVVSCCWIFG